MKLTAIITTVAILSKTTSAFALHPRALLKEKLGLAADKWNAESAKDSLNEAGDKISKQAGNAKDSLNDAGDRISKQAGNVKDSLNDAGDRFSKKAGNVKDSLNEHAGNAKDSLNEAGDNIIKQAEKVPKYLETQRVLLFDATKNKKRLAQNWGWIVTEGTLQVAVGMFALLAPTLATAVTTIQQSFLLMAIGAMNVLSSLFVEETFQIRNVLLGASQILLGYLLSVDPYDFALVTTLGVAATAFVDGSFRAVTALRNKDLPDRGWLFAGGIASLLGSQIIWKNINKPLAVLGTLLGIKFVSSGVTRIRAGLTGRNIANGVIV